MNDLHYILDDNNLAVPVADHMEWAIWFEAATKNRRRVVAQEDIGPYWVSTVFLVLDHGWHSELPILFETMIFSGDFSDLWMDRCGTWEEAIDMHERAVAQCMTWMRQLPVVIPCGSHSLH